MNTIRAPTGKRFLKEAATNASASEHKADKNAPDIMVAVPAKGFGATLSSTLRGTII